jgi:hypothetical protein
LKSLSVPEIFVAETKPRHGQATARRMLMPLEKIQVFLLKGMLASNLSRDPFNRPAETGLFFLMTLGTSCLACPGFTPGLPWVVLPTRLALKGP